MVKKVTEAQKFERERLVKALQNAKVLVNEVPSREVSSANRLAALRVLDRGLSIMGNHERQVSLATSMFFEECEFNGNQTEALLKLLVNFKAVSCANFLVLPVEVIEAHLIHDVRARPNPYPLVLRALHRAYNAK